ncbi:MAG TPA: phosphomevalonate kinase [Candidatus Ligilactobacillus excrementipullorum]|nr:phosphomevalonate kinase [Candidatus Ligilactobacillus excrementipullorum]
MIKVKAPGKLYLAGEYAVVETGYPAILVALNQFVHVSVEESHDYGSIISRQYKEESIYWKRQGNQMIFDNRDNPFHYILSGIKIAEQYARSLGKKMCCYHLRIDSELDSPDGKKYGLGSSAAVTVATVKALCVFYDLSVTKDQLFKLAAIAHFEVQGNGSLGDIAASVYGGYIAYHSFDREWLELARREYTLNELVELKWPQLKIEILDPPADLKLLIGWTGSPASTSHLVDVVGLKKAEKKAKYQRFLQENTVCLEKIIHGFHRKSLALIQEGLQQNRKILNDLAAFSNFELETPKLRRLIEIAESFGGVAKSSGAGGGDCGIAVLTSSIDSDQVYTQWRHADIEPLNLQVHNVID